MPRRPRLTRVVEERGHCRGSRRPWPAARARPGQDRASLRRTFDERRRRDVQVEGDRGRAGMQLRQEPRSIVGHGGLALQEELLHRRVVRGTGSFQQDARGTEVGDRLEGFDPFGAVVPDVALTVLSAKARGHPTAPRSSAESQITSNGLKKTSPERWTSGATPSAAKGFTIALRSAMVLGGSRPARSSSALL